MNFLSNRFRLQHLVVCVATAMVSLSAWAVEPFKLKDIRVEGLQRVESGTVFASLPFRIGDLYNDESGAAAIRALFGRVLSIRCGKMKKVSSSRCRKMSAKVIGGAFPTNDCSGNSWLFDRFSQG
jgi:outer membrane protein assembly factor BamA